MEPPTSTGGLPGGAQLRAPMSRGHSAPVAALLGVARRVPATAAGVQRAGAGDAPPAKRQWLSVPAPCGWRALCSRGASGATGTVPRASWAWAAAWRRGVQAAAVTRVPGSGVTCAAGVGWQCRRCQELRGLSWDAQVRGAQLPGAGGAPGVGGSGSASNRAMGLATQLGTAWCTATAAGMGTHRQSPALWGSGARGMGSRQSSVCRACAGLGLPVVG